MVRDGPEELVREDDVHHRHLVDDHEVGVEGLVESVPEAPGRRVELEQPMDGGCLEPGGLREPLRGPAGWRAEAGAHPLRAHDAQHRVDDGGLPDPGSPRDDGDPLADGAGHRRALRARELEAHPLLRPRDRLLRIDVPPRRAARRQGGGRDGPPRRARSGAGRGGMSTNPRRASRPRAPRRRARARAPSRRSPHPPRAARRWLRRGLPARPRSGPRWRAPGARDGSPPGRGGSSRNRTRGTARSRRRCGSRSRARRGRAGRGSRGRGPPPGPRRAGRSGPPGPTPPRATGGTP